MLQLAKHRTLTTEPVYKFQNKHSVDFDGADEFIQLGQPISYTQHTISAWIKFSDENSSRVIFDARDSNDDGISIFLTSLEKITYRIGDGSASDLTSNSLTINEWHQIVATYDGTTQKLYINGALDQSATTSKTIDTTTNAKIGIVAYVDVAPFKGKIDELAIWDRALTAAEVTEIYRIKYGANLVQNGRFDELGGELAPASDFATDFEANPASGSVSQSNGTIIFTNSTSTGSQVQLKNRSISTGKTYKIQFTVSNYSSGNFRISVGNQITDSVTANGTYTFYVQYNNGLARNYFYSSGSTLTVSEISVKQVDPNNRWNNIDNQFSFVNNGGKLTGTDSGQARLYSIPAPTSAGKTYKVSYTVVENNGTSLQHYDGDSYETITSTVGDHSFIYTRQGSNNNFILRNPSGASAFIVLTNIMLQEQKYVASNLKLNKGNYKSADPVIVSTKSVDFDGGEEYLEVTKKDFLGTSDFTLSYWIKPNTVSQDNYIMGQYTDDNNRWYMRVKNDARIQFYSLNSSSQVISLIAGTAVANVWNHIVVTADRDNECKLYHNGVLIDTGGASTASLTFNSNLEIGAFRHFNGYFNGTIDEFGIFSSALSSDQVGELYNQGVPSNLTTSSAGVDGLLAAYYKMGDGTLDEAPLIADQTNATLGSEIMTDGNFSEGLTHYTTNNVEVSNGVVSFDSSSDWIFQNHGSSFTTGKIYQVSTQGTGNLRFRYGFTNTAGTLQAFTVGTNLYFVADSDTNRIQFFGSASSSAATLSNISVKQVNGNPALMINTPTIVTDAPLTKIRNYYRMGDGILDTHPLICDMVEPSLGSEQIANGTFDSDTLWGKTNAVIENGVATITVPDGGAYSAITQTNANMNSALISGKAYKLTATINGTSGKLIRFQDNSSNTGGLTVANGTFTLTGSSQEIKVFWLANSNSNIITIVRSTSEAYSFTVDNVSVKQVNGVAGLMQNMTESDITNDVPS